MIFGAPKSEYKAAVEGLLVLMEKAERPLRDAIATLERMKRLQFKSPKKAAEMAARVREAADVLAPFVERYCLNPIAENFRKSEATARDAAKES